MGRDLRQEALTYLINKADEQGYVTFDEIMDCADANSLPIQDFDWLSNAITTRGILVYDEVPTNRVVQDPDDNYEDYAQSDYEYVYNRIIELDDSLTDFVNRVRKIKPRQWKEFSQLKYQVIEGNKHARDRMIEMHLRIALRIALQRTEIYDMDIQDAVGDACIGLVLAVDKYDPEINGAFSSYASMWILQNISRNQPTKRPLVYYPVHKKEQFFSAYSLIKASGYDEGAMNDEKVKEFLKKELLLTEEQVDDVLIAMIPFESLDNLFANNLEEDDFFEDDVYTQIEKRHKTKELKYEPDIEEKIIFSVLKEEIIKALNTLTIREKQVLVLRYGLNDDEAKTLEEVGNEFKVTRERIRQIEAKALRKLAQLKMCSVLKEYV